MNDMNDNEIEAMLKGLPLRKPPSSLDAKIRTLLHPHRLHWMARALAAAATIAAGLVLAFMIRTSALNHNNRNQPAGTGEPRMASTLGAGMETVAARDTASPVVTEQTWTRTDYGDLILVDGQRPVRQFRRQHVQQVQWTDPQRGVQMQMTIPRAEVILVDAKAD